MTIEELNLILLQVVDRYNKVPFDLLTKEYVRIKILSILKVVSFKSLAGIMTFLNGVRTQVEAYCERISC